MVRKPQIYLAEGSVQTRQPRGAVTRGMRWASTQDKLRIKDRGPENHGTGS
jgi:hypothetical protein